MQKQNKKLMPEAVKRYKITKKMEREMPVVSKILKQLTPERIKKEIEAVQSFELPPELQKWVKEYEKVGDRDEFIWKDLYRVFEFFFLPTVSKKYYKQLTETKVLATIFVALIDDIADKAKNEKLLKSVFLILFEKDCKKNYLFNQEEKRYFFLVKKVWHALKSKIEKYPRFKEFKELFFYDIHQVVNAMHYSLIINKKPYLINTTEMWAYGSFNMMILVYMTMDLMCSSNKLKLQELKVLREIGYYFQKMARIGNWISTWEREIKEEDFANGIITYALTSGIVSYKEIKKRNKQILIEKIKKSKVEEELLRAWEENYWRVAKLCKQTKNINKMEFLFFLRKIFFMHLSSTGYK